MTVPRETILDALRITLQRLETQHCDGADEPALHTLKAQVIAALAEMELREQAALELEPPPELPHPVLAALAVLLAERQAAAPELVATEVAAPELTAPVPLPPIESAE